MLEVGVVVYAGWEHQLFVYLRVSGSVFQDLRRAAILYQQFWAERIRQVELCQQDTAGRNYGQDFFELTLGR